MVLTVVFLILPALWDITQCLLVNRLVVDVSWESSAFIFRVKQIDTT